MGNPRHELLKDLFGQALALPREERLPFAEASCGEDVELLRELCSLLDYHQDERPFLDPDAARTVPARIGPYQILGEIDRGGVGIVYEAQQDAPNRIVALKVLYPGVVSPSGLRRFELEAEALGRLQHPGIAQVYDAHVAGAEDGSQPYLAMERIHGQPIVDSAESAELSDRERLALLALVCDAVQHAHGRGVIHRDLKPSNILVDELGQPKVLDFGIARLVDTDLRTTLGTQTGQIVGTVAYMSPEQASGSVDDVEVRCDVYALGVIGYELLTGQRPHATTGIGLHEALRMIAEEEPRNLARVRPELQGDVATIVHKAIERDRALRYPSAEALAADIRRYLDDLPIEARPATVFYQLSRFARRHKVMVAGVLASTLSLVVGMISTLVFALESRESERRMGQALYRTRITATLDSLRKHDVSAAESTLAAIEDPEQQENWEYRYLRARMQPVIARHSWSDASVNRSRNAFTAEGHPRVVHLQGADAVVFDLHLDRPVASVPVGENVELLALSRDATRVGALARTSSGERAWELRILDLEGSGERRYVIDGLDPQQIGFSPDGSAVVLAGADVVAAYEASSGRELWSTALVDDGRMVLDRVLDLSVAGTGDWRVAVLRDSNVGSHITVLEGRGGLVAEHAVDTGTCVALRPDGEVLAFGTGVLTRDVVLWDIASWEPRGVLPGHFGGALGVAWSDDGHRLLTASAGGVRTWDARSGLTLASFSVPLGGVASIGWHRERVLVAESTRAELLNVRHGASLEMAHDRYVYMVSVSPDGLLVAARSFDYELYLWDPLSGARIARLLANQNAKGVGFSPDGAELWFSSDGLEVRDTATSAVLETGVWDTENYLRQVRGGSKAVAHGFAGESWATSPDRTLLVRGGEHGEVEVVELSTSETVLRLAAHDGVVLAVAVSPGNRWLATGGADEQLRLWDLRDGELVASVDHNSEVYSLAFHPEESRLASGGDNAAVLLWETPGLARVAQLDGHGDYVHSVAFSPDGSYLVSGSGDGTTRLWDTIPRQERLRAAAQAERARARMEPAVAALRERLGDAAEVAAHLRADSGLAEVERRAALRLLFARELSASGESGR